MTGAGRPSRRLMRAVSIRLRPHPRVGSDDPSACARCTRPSIDLSTGRVERLLAALGHPERRLPPVIHVAGTNGKGSTIAYLRAIAEAAGLSRPRANLAASGPLRRAHPHRRAADRRRGLAGPARRGRGGQRQGQPISFFEITTAAAFLAFARTPADLRCSRSASAAGSTPPTCSSAPAVTVITPVALDHLEIARPDARRDRLGEGRHHQARRPRRGRPPAPTRRWRSSRPRPPPSAPPWSGWAATSTSAVECWSIGASDGCWTCRRRAWPARTSSPTPAWPRRGSSLGEPRIDEAGAGPRGAPRSTGRRGCSA